ncbi:hypothetical protein ACFFHH_11010 [Cytobacillus solani]|uniref:Uncharacterized protein n=1 Tax=Cytobacillus solani TaxID=1637975 RepID=A0A0Q3QRJ9_9BACI|nr:hypothetical protein [Cytobacillus solani]KOP83724.1 hypothetical protein AMS60_15225 [Bacillus sp. FJAT-21945]KQL20801.1 hypothetical protein AN957_20845 [Cytobacillus solani]USK54040.1 hypothetical protein LIS82_20925 [Cytobacillus solani]
MNKNRYLLCLLVCGLLLYYAAPRLDVFSEGLAGVFAISWLAFALVVIAGNLTALLYSPKNTTANIKTRGKMTEKKRARSF